MEKAKISFDEFRKIVLEDFRLAEVSRQTSLLGRKEVLTGKAKFGIFGDGKEVAQIAMAKAFKDGDFRSGYYRDQTFMMAIGALSVREFFAQLYADTNQENEPASAGRMMNGHFSTRTIDKDGNWLDLTKRKNSSADISPTASQMLRLVGLAYASKLFRQNEELHQYATLSNKGNEVAFGTIGNASAAEGLFWESINAGGVLMGPMAVSIWDDEYGISVPAKYQITKQDFTEILSGFSYSEEKQQGYSIYTAKGWDYPSLVKMYEDGIEKVRTQHIPAIFHIKEMTQPQGHSTSGSHERYKSKERLKWESDFDCIAKMREWILTNAIANEEELATIENEAKDFVKNEQKAAWEDFFNPIKKERKEISILLSNLANVNTEFSEKLTSMSEQVLASIDMDRRSSIKVLWEAIRITKNFESEERNALLQWLGKSNIENAERFNSNLYSGSALKVAEINPVYSRDSKIVDGREILLACFDNAFKSDSKVFAFGEDVGKIGDVNQGMAGLQEKYGELRVTDTGIREASIIGQGIGAAMRGLRPIAEIQYLDYLLYGLQILSDDLATLLYRTKGTQKAPLIVRTRGHRLEGVWHAGSPMGAIINALRGMYVCVPRNMTQAARFYNTLLKADEPALVIERLNGYRTKEKLPDNVESMTLALGIPELLCEGEDVTIVTYGACVEIAMEAITKLNDCNITVDLIDVQTLLPFDIHHSIVNSLKKTNRIIFLDEDVPGGASSFMMQQVLEVQGGYKYLDSQPVTISAKAHRPAYGTDGDYFSKPNAEEVFEVVYALVREGNNKEFGKIF